jgi:hypothetical protein
VLDPGAEGSGVDRRKAVKRGLDLAEVAPHPLGVDEPGAHEGLDVAAIAGVVTLELRERLRVGVEVAERKPLTAVDERASFLPSARKRDEVARERELDVDLQLVLEPRDRSQDRVLIGYELEVDVDRRCAPAGEDSGRPADQVADAVLLRGGVERSQQTLDPLPVG